MKKYILIIALLFGLNQAFAQNNNPSQEREGRGPELISFNFCLGYGMPSMDFWNDYYLDRNGIHEDFTGGIKYDLFVQFKLSPEIYARTGLGYWSEKVKGTDESTFRSVRISFTSLLIGASYEPEYIQLGPLQPYIGLQSDMYLIYNSFLDRNNEKSTHNGEDISFAGFLGLSTEFNRVLLGIG